MQNNKKVLASPYLQTFWNSYQLNPECTDYNVVINQKLHGQLNLSQLKSAVCRFAQDYFIFQSHLIAKNDRLYWQKNHPSFTDIETFSSNTLNVDQLIKTFIAKPFVLDQGPLCRFGIFIKDENNSEIIFVLHHVLVDASAAEEFINEISHYFNDPTYRFKLSLNEQMEQIEQISTLLYKKITISKNANKFWQDQLAELPTKMELPYLQTDNALRTKKFEYFFTIANADYEYLMQFNKSHHVTLFLVLQTVWLILGARYTRQNKIYTYYPVLIKEMIGLFKGCGINTLISPLVLEPNVNFLELCQKVKNFVNEIQAGNYKYLPLHDILRNSNIKELNFAISETLFETNKFNFNKMKVSMEDFIEVNAGAELFFAYGHKKNNQILGRIQCRADLFTNQFIATLASHYYTLLKSCLQNPSTPVLNHPLLSAAEFHQLIDAQHSASKYVIESNLCQRFEAQVAINPEKIAVSFGDTELSYQELNLRANQLARYLRLRYREVTNDELSNNTLIGLSVVRNELVVLAILAILKAGAGYVPLDPLQPKERLEFIISDSHLKIIITESSLESQLSSPNLGAIYLDTEWKNILEQESTNLVNNISCDNYAYLIYTSGTTGNPKGVLITHHHILRLFSVTEPIFSFNSDDIWTLFHSYAFDFSVWELWGALLYGGHLIIVSEAVTKNIELFWHLIEDQGVTILNQTPSAFQALAQYAAQRKQNKMLTSNKLRYVIFGGEALFTKHIQSWCQQFGLEAPELINMYGITEITVHASYYKVKERDLLQNKIPIGTSLDDLNFYILDSALNCVPIGVVGELFIGGPGLALGYWQRETLTQERFIKNPFVLMREINPRLYKTGDLVRWLDQNNIEYIGRNDSQVKIRGFRIELGDIEAQLARYPSIKQCIVTVHQTGLDKHLAAYYVTEKLETVNEQALRAELKIHLPPYMIPDYFIRLEKIPLTVNGKTDYRALPSPDEIRKSTESIVLPRDKKERKLAKMWSYVLGIEGIGVHDDFFQLGGNSLSILRLKVLIEDEFHLHITLSDLFIHTTIAEFAKALSNTSFQPVVKLNQYEDGNGLLFLIHTARGSAEVYRKLAKYLNITTFGIESYNLYATPPLIEQIDVLCEQYAEYILETFDLTQRLFIGGWSFGGLLALKVAERILLETGKKAELIILFDTLPPHLAKLLAQQKNSDAVISESKLNLARYGHKLKTLKSNFVEKISEVGTLHDHMVASYTLKAYPEPVLLIKASEQMLLKVESKQLFSLLSQAEDYDWHRYISGEVNITTSLGNHETMFDKDNLEYLAKILNPYFDEKK